MMALHLKSDHWNQNFQSQINYVSNLTLNRVYDSWVAYCSLFRSDLRLWVSVNLLNFKYHTKCNQAIKYRRQPTPKGKVFHSLTRIVIFFPVVIKRGIKCFLPTQVFVRRCLGGDHCVISGINWITGNGWRYCTRGTGTIYFCCNFLQLVYVWILQTSKVKTVVGCAFIFPQWIHLDDILK